MAAKARARHDLQAALDRAVVAINEALNAAQPVGVNALNLEAGGTLYALKPEPADHAHRDTTTTQRRTLILAASEGRARCDVGAW